MILPLIRNIILLSSAFLATLAYAQNCGPAHGNARCANPSDCCSQYGWCGQTSAHCDLATCFRSASGANSPCAPSSATRTTTPTATSFPSYIPEIDVCGASHGIGCPRVGAAGYYYRCCSPAGHCGPKNPLQDPAQYCGSGCQPGFGDCSFQAVPPNPAPAPIVNPSPGGLCGPIINRRCQSNECCSGSNFCGVGEDYCGAANWCQRAYGGRCD